LFAIDGLIFHFSSIRGERHLFTGGVATPIPRLVAMNAIRPITLRQQGLRGLTNIIGNSWNKDKNPLFYKHFIQPACRLRLAIQAIIIYPARLP
jgi:hypothetical protein